jgi:hypothetical protein
MDRNHAPVLPRFVVTAPTIVNPQHFPAEHNSFLDKFTDRQRAPAPLAVWITRPPACSCVMTRLVRRSDAVPVDTMSYWAALLFTLSYPTDSVSDRGC